MRLSCKCYALVGLLANLAVLAGCSDGLPKRVPVSGIVLVDGQSATSGTIEFAPVSGGRVAAGEIGSDGRFTLTTFKPGDGCTIGDHKVTINSYKDLAGNIRHWLLPKKYAIPGTSPLVISVQEATANAKFELSWNGRKGPEIERYD
jgi:hypothetical protein